MLFSFNPLIVLVLAHKCLNFHIWLNWIDLGPGWARVKLVCILITGFSSVAQLLSSAHENSTTLTSAGHVHVHMYYMCEAGMWCGVVKPSTPPELREARWSSPRVFSGFTCSVPPKHLPHFLLSELNSVPWEDSRGDHVGQGDFQSRDSLYKRLCGGWSRKHSPTRDKTSSKYNTCTLNIMWKLWLKALLLTYSHICACVCVEYICIFAG